MAGARRPAPWSMLQCAGGCGRAVFCAAPQQAAGGCESVGVLRGAAAANCGRICTASNGCAQNEQETAPLAIASAGESVTRSRATLPA